MKRLAYSHRPKKQDDITLTKTALVHEVYIKMVKQACIKIRDRSHFLAICTCYKRHILVGHARKKQARKRGGGQRNVTYIDELMS